MWCAGVARKDVTDFCPLEHTIPTVALPSGGRVELIAHIDHLAGIAGDRNVWLRITKTFRLSEDPGTSLLAFTPLRAAIGPYPCRPTFYTARTVRPARRAAPSWRVSAETNSEGA